MSQILVVNTGGQYCHLIARRIREHGVLAEVCPPHIPASKLRNARGVIISGGPKSVYANDAIHCPSELFSENVPVLGICYGHQLMAYQLGGKIQPGSRREYGAATLEIIGQDTILNGLHRQDQVVWMSHGDEVIVPPPDFDVLARTETCSVAVMADKSRRRFGLQFHPEVTDTECGSTILRNFLFKVCDCSIDWNVRAQVSALEERIQQFVGNRRVIFFVSGGVDSTVAFALCTEALGPDHVLGVFVDTGFMRKNERHIIENAFRRRGWRNIRFESAQDLFLGRLSNVADPEEKRQIIGDCFLQIQDQVSKELDLSSGDWVLGQGTIYPDTIESGQSQNSALIKTHHNRVPAIGELIAKGLLLEPLTDFYKDEVREVGRELGLPHDMLAKHPFPGPGLAVRCICATDDLAIKTPEELKAAVRRKFRLGVWLIPLRTVGVQGDYRSYSNLAMLYGKADLQTYGRAASEITSEFPSINRVVFMVQPETIPSTNDALVKRAFIDQDRLRLLREADDIAHDMLQEWDRSGDVWQFPVVLFPLTFGQGETIGLRPVWSVDAMTARFAELPMEFIDELGERLSRLPGVDAVVYDVTSKPPATIEWE